MVYLFQVDTDSKFNNCNLKEAIDRVTEIYNEYVTNNKEKGMVKVGG